MQTNQKRELPYEVIKLALSLMPHLTTIFEECELSPMDLFVLTHIKHFGKDFDKGLKIVLREDMTDLLTKVFRESDSKVSKDINKLRDKEFLAGIRINDNQMREIFGKEEGRRFALVLRQSGIEKINEFTDKISQLFIDLNADMHDYSFKLLTRGLKIFASVAINKVNSQSNF